MKRVLIGVVLAAASLHGWVGLPIGAYEGEPIRWHNAQDLAFCGLTGPGAGAVFTSPGLLGFVERPELELSSGLRWRSEQRTRTVYDEFENAIGEFVAADNQGMSWIPGPLAGTVPVLNRGAVAAGFAPVRDFYYQYRKEYRDDFYNLIGEDRIEQTGAVFQAGIGAGFRPVNWLSLGASGGYVFGSRELKSWVIRYPDTTYERGWGSPTGIAYAGGIAVQPLPQLAAVLSFQAGTRLSNWQSPTWLIERLDWVQPWEARLAVSYGAAGVLPSRALVELGYRHYDEWSSVVFARAGVEHRMIDFVKLRYGFGIEPLAEDPSVQLVQVGAGVGFEMKPVRVDIGAMFGRDVLGPNSYQFFWPVPLEERVYETGAVLAVTVSREF